MTWAKLRHVICIQGLVLICCKDQARALWYAHIIDIRCREKRLILDILG